MFRNVEKIPPTDHFIVQEYVEKPLLLDGYKFDLRIYVLITSCDPLRIFLFNDGLVRMSTEKYLPPQENNLVRHAVFPFKIVFYFVFKGMDILAVEGAQSNIFCLSYQIVSSIKKKIKLLPRK